MTNSPPGCGFFIGGARCNAASCRQPSSLPPCSLPPAPCLPQPAEVIADLRRLCRKFTLRFCGYMFGIGAANLVGYTLIGVSGIVPFPSAAKWLDAGTQMLLGSIVIVSARDAIWNGWMLWHGVASSGGQQPSKP